MKEDVTDIVSETPVAPGGDQLQEMAIYFITYNREARSVSNEGSDKPTVAPFSTLGVQVQLTSEEARRIRDEIGLARGIFVETKQADGDPHRIMFAVGQLAQ